MRELKHRVGHHRKHEDNAIAGVDHQVLEFRTQLMHTEDRINRLEVKV